MARKKRSFQDQKIRSPPDVPARVAEDSVESKPATVADPGESPDAQPKKGFPIVGIGAGMEATLARDGESETPECRAAMSDITERKKVEEMLMEEKAFSEGIFNTARAIILVLDAKGRIITFNKFMEELTGYSLDEVKGKDWFSTFLPETDWEKIRGLFLRAISDNQSKGNINPIVAKDGRFIQVEWYTNTLKKSSGELVGLISIGLDVSDRERSAEETAKAKEAAEAANRAKSEFLANMSHEIRTPMTAILGFSDLLLTPNLNRQDQREYLQGIQKNGQALLELINDLIDISKIEAGNLSVKPANCAIPQVLNDALSIVKIRAEQKGLSLDVNYDEPLPKTIITDPIKLRQILVNLIGNAVKFTEHGGVQVLARCQTLEDRSARIQFVISDTGIGIPPEKLGDLFQPFMQTDSSLTRRHGGAGLGLAISNRLAIALGGDIEVISQAGQGSTFTLTVAVQLPKEEVLPQSGAKPWGKTDDAALEEEGPPIQGRILLVEDVPDVRKVICAVLDRIGLKTDTAKNGRAACEMAANSLTEGSPYDLILMDIQMPVMDGCAATRRLRRHGWQRPIVALTAYAMSGDREKCLAAGCDDYLAKPINIAELQKVLIRHLGQGKVATELFKESQEEPRGILKSGVLDAAVVAKLMQQFREELPGRAELIGKAYDDKDRTQLMHLIHQLKGATGIYGLKQISETACLVHQLVQEDVALEELQATISELVDMCKQAAAQQPQDSLGRHTISHTKKPSLHQRQSSRRKREQN